MFYEEEAIEALEKAQLCTMVHLPLMASYGQTDHTTQSTYIPNAGLSIYVIFYLGL